MSIKESGIYHANFEEIVSYFPEDKRDIIRLLIMAFVVRYEIPDYCKEYLTKDIEFALTPVFMSTKIDKTRYSNKKIIDQKITMLENTTFKGDASDKEIAQAIKKLKKLRSKVNQTYIKDITVEMEQCCGTNVWNLLERLWQSEQMKRRRHEQRRANN